tara:strand:+ start:239 stop:421 length:183 start_codon:yes stop_codon:yes gene_type:complete
MKFEEVKEKIRTFVKDELIALEPWIVNSEWNEKLPKLNELREKVKKWASGYLKFQKNMVV